MKLSDLHPDEVQVVANPEQAAQLRLSDLHPDDVKVVSKEDEPKEENGGLLQDIQNASLGGAKGLTLGFAPKIEAGVQAGIEKIKGSKEDLSDLYKKYNEVRQKQYDDAQKQSPKSFLAGELAGGVGLAGLTGGMGLGAAVSSLAEQAAIGSGLGALAGVGNTKEDLTSEEGRNKAALEALSGAGVGGALGAALPAAGKVIKGATGALSEYAESNPTLQKMLMAYKQGTQGNNLVSPEFGKQSLGNLQSNSEALSSKLIAGRNTALQNIGDMLEQSPEKFDATNLVDNGLQAIDKLGSEQKSILANRDYDRLKSLLEDFNQSTQEGTSVEPKELFNLRKSLTAIKSNSNEPEVSEIAKNAINGIDDKLSNIPEYSDALDSLQTYSSAVPNISSSGLSKQAQLATQNNVNPETLNAQSDFDNLLQRLNDAEEQKPGFLSSLGLKDTDKLIDKLKESAKLENLRQEAAQPGTTGLLGAVANIPGKLLELSHVAPRTQTGTKFLAANQAGRGVYFANDLSKSLFSAAPETLQQVGQHLSTNGFQHLGSALQKGVADNNSGLINATIFSILQTPQARSILSRE